jgi:hypothetical protein
MNETLNIVEEMDDAILKATGGKPADYDLQSLFNECQTYQQSLYGGGEQNRAETEYIEGIRAREAEIASRRNQLIDDTEEAEELETEELDDLGRDGIFIKR